MKKGIAKLEVLACVQTSERLKYTPVFYVTATKNGPFLPGQKTRIRTFGTTKFTNREVLPMRDTSHPGIHKELWPHLWHFQHDQR